MKPITSAKRIALRSYSMWANYLGIAALIMPELIYVIWQIDTNPRIWWIAGLVLILFGIGGRLIDQGITRSPVLVVLASVFLAMSQAPAPAKTERSPTGQFLDVALPLIAEWEGLRTTAYRDIVGVWTVCYGETKGVRPGDTYTERECLAMLAREVIAYRDGWHTYLTPETIATRLPVTRDAAYTSLAYNVGIHGAGKSTATRRLNAGDIAGGCKAIGWWNRAGGRVVRGLVNRRTEEVQLCMIGVA